MRPPVCEICDADVDPAGGLVTFQPDDESRDWHRRAEEEGFVGHPPDVGWFCTEHVDAAREAARTMSYGPGVRHVAGLDDAPSRSVGVPVAARLGPLDPEPDLVGVDLGAGRLDASEEFDQRRIAWDLPPTDVALVVRALERALPDLCRAVDAGEPRTLVAHTNRSWSPMDGAQPPHCPFVDTHVATGTTTTDAAIRLEHELAQWNEDEVNTATARCTITTGGERVVAISVFGENPGGRLVRSLWLRRPTNSSVVRIVDDLVARLPRS